MTHRRRFLALLSLVGLIAASSALAERSAVSALSAPATTFRVTSSLAGKQVLPHRIHWLARTTLPPAQVTEVDFLIDGRLGFIEQHAPYTYGRDGNWLVTSWLTPGRHRFGVRVTATDGRKVTVATVARVLPAPAAPAELAGRWERQYSKEETGDAPAGLWTLSVDRSGWKIRDPAGGGNYIDVSYVGPQLLETRGGIWTRPHSAQEGNGWCEDTNEPVRFRWTLDGDGVTFTLAGPKRCDGLGDFLSKTWTRA